MIGRALGLNDVQVRKDLASISQRGRPKIGYITKELIYDIEQFLGYDNTQNAVIVGAGNLGRAIASHINFESKGFKLVGIFDTNPAIIGDKIGDVEISDMDELDKICEEYNPRCAILCIPKEAASKEVDRLIAKGIRAFWNFTHYDLRINHSDVSVENVHLGDSLATLSYRLNSESETCGND